MPLDLDAVRSRLSARGERPGPAEVADALAWLGHVVSDTTVLATVEALRRDSVGAGPLDALLRTPGVTDVVVNGADAVYVDRGFGLELTEVRFASDDAVRRLAVRLAAQAGRRLDDAQPFVDARLPDGVRVHAVLGSVCDPGTCVSLRVPSRKRWSLQEWVAMGSLTPSAARLLRGLVQARRAVLVTGGTGTGKTTLLAALLGEVPADERIVVVEDSRELAPDHPHVVRMEGRPPNAEGVGAVTMTTLVRNALRMRPDRLVVGEVRGAELCDLLAALNTGHEGGMGTVHANDPESVPARLEALGALGGLGRDALHAQVGAALDAVVHLRREPGRRWVEQVAVLRADASGLIRAVPGITWRSDGDEHLGEGMADLDRLAAS